MAGPGLRHGVLTMPITRRTVIPNTRAASGHSRNFVGHFRSGPASITARRPSAMLLRQAGGDGVGGVAVQAVAGVVVAAGGAGVWQA